DQEAVNTLVDYALEHGVNYFDTAPVYLQGQSEAAVGKALSRHPRDKYFIATKISNMGATDLKSAQDMYHNSLKQLQVDYIDYLLMHFVGIGGLDMFKKRFIDNGMLDYLLKEKEAGRVRHLGWSFHGDVKVVEYLLEMQDEGKARWDFVQIQHNYIDWKLASGFNTPSEYLYGELAKRNIPVVVMEPLLGGRLSNLPDHILARLKQREPERSAASWAFRYAGTMPMVLTALSGMTYMEHLQDNLRTFQNFKPLTEEEINFLYETASLIDQYPTVPCNDCKYCMPCPYGVDIPAILLHYNKCVNQGNIAESAQDPEYRRMRQVYLVGYDRSVPKLRQADHCIGCNQCSPHCPQNIRIPQELQKINEYVESLKKDTLGQPKEA
ncbi:MAG: aldo/keto reductase, partial [Bacteroidaceae bacterium]|nr:aldo/keto reductase [Bacteroidaceae bacterium]